MEANLLNPTTQKADAALKNLVADAFKIQHESLRNKRLHQLDTLIQTLQELEAYVQHLEKELTQSGNKHNYWFDRYKKMWHEWELWREKYWALKDQLDHQIKQAA